MSSYYNIINRYKVIIISLATTLLGIILLIITTQIHPDNIWAEILKTLGTIFVPSGLLSLVYEYSLRKTFLEEMREQLISTFETKFDTLKHIENLGIRTGYSSMPTQSAMSSIEIITIY